MLSRLRLTFLTVATLITTNCDNQLNKSAKNTVTNNAKSEVVEETDTRKMDAFNSSALTTKGLASWYGPNFHGKQTANGEIYDQYEMTAAHKTLPLGTWVRVTNEDNGRTVNVRINDRGPYAKGRIIDVSKKAAQKLGFSDDGVVHVKVCVLKGKDLARAKAEAAAEQRKIEFQLQQAKAAEAAKETQTDTLAKPTPVTKPEMAGFSF